jgi:hypothetical protein
MPRYRAKQQKMRGTKSGKRQFLMLFRNVKRSAAYHGLSTYGRAALIELIDRYRGDNNGMIGLGVRELAYELRCSQDAASRALRELDDAKLAYPVTVGVWRGRKASEWRLTFRLCNKTGELPTTQWEQRRPFSEYASESAKVRQEKRKELLSTRAKAQTPKSSMKGVGPSTPAEAHIDSTMPLRNTTGSGLGKLKTRKLAWLDKWKANNFGISA